MIQDVEHFGAELHSNSFSKTRILQQCQVHVHKPRADHRVPSQVAECPRILERETVRVEPLIDAADLHVTTCNIIRSSATAGERAVKTSADGEGKAAVCRRDAGHLPAFNNAVAF